MGSTQYSQVALLYLNVQQPIHTQQYTVAHACVQLCARRHELRLKPRRILRVRALRAVALRRERRRLGRALVDARLGALHGERGCGAGGGAARPLASVDDSRVRVGLARPKLLLTS